MSGGGPTRKRERHAPARFACAVCVERRTVLRGRGSGNIPSLPDNLVCTSAPTFKVSWGAFRCSVYLQKISQKNHKKQPL